MRERSVDRLRRPRARPRDHAGVRPDERSHTGSVSAAACMLAIALAEIRSPPIKIVGGSASGVTGAGGRLSMRNGRSCLPHRAPDAATSASPPNGCRDRIRIPAGARVDERNGEREAPAPPTCRPTRVLRRPGNSRSRSAARAVSGHAVPDQRVAPVVRARRRAAPTAPRDRCPLAVKARVRHPVVPAAGQRPARRSVAASRAGQVRGNTRCPTHRLLRRYVGYRLKRCKRVYTLGVW